MTTTCSKTQHWQDNNDHDNYWHNQYKTNNSQSNNSHNHMHTHKNNLNCNLKKKKKKKKTTSCVPPTNIGQHMKLINELRHNQSHQYEQCYQQARKLNYRQWHKQPTQ